MVHKKVKEAIQLLNELQLPKAQQNERSALILLALAGIGPSDHWNRAQKKLLRTVDIMAFMSQKYQKKYAPNSRETIRRQTLHQFVQARIADINPDDPSRPTNSGNTVYSLTNDALNIVKNYEGKKWKSIVLKFLEKIGALKDEYAKRRMLTLIPVKLPDGREFHLSPGAHNKLQASIINEFAPRFAGGATVVYLGDTSHKQLVYDATLMKKLNVEITEHDKLPDVILYDRKRNWLFLIEAVTTHGPVSPKRYKEIEEMLAACHAERIYVTAFPDISIFKKYAQDVVWESEAWIAANPDHLIHFNGDKFLGPYAKKYQAE